MIRQMHTMIVTSRLGRSSSTTARRRRARQRAIVIPSRADGAESRASLWTEILRVTGLTQMVIVESATAEKRTPTVTVKTKKACDERKPKVGLRAWCRQD